MSLECYLPTIKDYCEDISSKRIIRNKEDSMEVVACLDTSKGLIGFTDLIKKDKKLLKRLRRCVLEKNKRIAKNLMKHKRESVRLVGYIIYNGVEFELMNK